MPTKKTAKKAAKTAGKSAAPKPSKPSGSPAAVKAAEKPATHTARQKPATAKAVPKKAVKTVAKHLEPKSPKAAAGAVPSQPEAIASPDPTSADLVDSQLEKYRSMRDFNVTDEPSGGDAPTSAKAAPRPAPPRTKTNSGLPFVIQKHAASHLHYDFRLGWSGVLKSWAVAKGPSYVVADRRLAVQVEDHPMEYGGFEGIIPKGQYGGGTVMVWDQGTWWPQPGHENVEAGLRTGSLKFEMHGTKMQGKWTLVRMHTTRPYPGENGRWKSNDKPQWLLIKEHDAFERPATAPALVDEAPNSALTGRTMEEIAKQSDHVWNSKETATPGQAWYRQDTTGADSGVNGEAQPSSKTAASAPRQSAVAASKRSGAATDASSQTTKALKDSDSAAEEVPALRITPRPGTATSPGPRPLPHTLPAAVLGALEDLPREPQPEFLPPQLAQETEQPPEGSGWFHELKLDGYRMQARKSARGVQMLTRSGLDWTYRVPAVAEAVAQLPIGSVTLDGEVVVLAEDGNTNFAELQASFQNNEKHPLTFFCFDLLHLEGRNTRNLALLDRKALLAAILPKEDEAVVRLSEHMETNGRLMFEQACQFHAEGIISKRADEPYQVGRRSGWLKSKCLHEQEFVVGGFSKSSDGPDRIGSLLLGYYRDNKLIFAGRTGTGFTQKQRKELRTQLAPLETKAPPFASVPADQRRDAQWVRPELVAQVRFATWTAEDLVRQAAFLGLREDKRPEEVVREEPTTAPQPKSSNRKDATAPPQIQDAAKAGHPEQTRNLRKPAAAAAPAAGAAGTGQTLPSAPETLRLTHPKKILDPESGLTKQQLADFYWAVAERMLPHIADRPLSLVRCPDGAGKPCFYQKHVNHMLPPGIGSVMVADKKGGPPEPYITLNSPEALAGLAQIGVLEVHPWGSHNSNLECPDRLIFDLDPDESLPWSTVAEAAREVKTRLKKLHLESFLKTTGGKGLHIVAPITPRHDFATVKDLAHRFVTAMERANPRLYLTKMTKAARVGKIYLDYLRNERGATAVAPYSPRARPGITVSVPLDWKELDVPERPRFGVSDFPSWADRLRRDPWKRISSLRQDLDPDLLRSL